MQGEPNILVAKIAATPSSTSWAQAYNAGKLYAVISISSDPEKEIEKDFLNVLGKEIIETLEQEYYSLEVKDLSSIKKAFDEALRKAPQDVDISFIAGSVVKNIIYLFYSGEVQASIKRGGEFGELIDAKSIEKTSQTVSGILQDGDIIVLQTKQFTELVPQSLLVSSIEGQSPSEIAETIAPIIHQDEKNGAAALIIKCSFVQEEEETSKPIEENSEELVPESSPTSKFNLLSFPISILKLLRIPTLKGVNHKRKLILTIAIVIGLLLIATVFITINKQNETKINALYQDIYKNALEKYEEGEGLADLNKNVANDSFKEAYKILNEGKDKFEKGSEQEKQILELLAKVDSKMKENSPEQIVQRQDRSKISITIENGSGIEGTAGKASDFLKEKGYNVAKTQNADNYKYEGTTIKVKNSLNAYTDLLKKDLSEKYEVTDTNSDLPEDNSTDTVIIIGK